MTELKSPLDILRLLDQSNCRDCGKPTCLAFAGAVFKGEKRLQECPKLDSRVLEQHEVQTAGQPSISQLREESLVQLKQQISAIDLKAAAQKLGLPYQNGKLTLQCLGKNFSVHAKGEITTDIHVNPWVAGPIFDYILNGAGSTPCGQWVSFRELNDGEEWYPLYNQRCEKPLKKVIDNYPDLFDDMLQIFSGKRIEHNYPADISIVLHPLPKTPILVCYSGPEDGMDSNLAMFFDAKAQENLSIRSLYGLVAGLVTMFEKIALRHGRG